MKRLLALGAVVGGVAAAWTLLPSGKRAPEHPGRTTIGRRLMARMMERMPADSPPKLIMSILPRLREQNEEIIALLREQNELLRRERREPGPSEGEALG